MNTTPKSNNGNGRSIFAQILVIVAASISTAVIMSFIAPNGLRNSVKAIEVKQATIETDVKNHTERLKVLEEKQSQLATKADLQILKEDLIRELKK